jgi:putative colanic acid biosynthesis acetyltransferase WcaF
VSIEPEVWVAAGVFVSPGVRIGRGAVVAARSVVTRDLPPMMISAGSPAKPVRPRLPSGGPHANGNAELHALLNQ